MSPLSRLLCLRYPGYYVSAIPVIMSPLSRLRFVAWRRKREARIWLELCKELCRNFFKHLLANYLRKSRKITNFANVLWLILKSR